MALIKVIYVDEETVISAENLNAIQDAIIALEQGGGGGGTTNYNDLNNKPQIGGVELTGNKTASDLGLAPAGAYVKPSDGIPNTDLAAAVQTSLGKADTALQQHQDISGKADKIEEVTVSTAGAVTQALDPNVMYHFTGALTALTITLNAPASGQIAQYHFDFNCGSTAPTVTIPATVTLPDGNSFDANKHYEVDILNSYGVVAAWANS